MVGFTTLFGVTLLLCLLFDFREIANSFYIFDSPATKLMNTLFILVKTKSSAYIFFILVQPNIYVSFDSHVTKYIFMFLIILRNQSSLHFSCKKNDYLFIHVQTQPVSTCFIRVETKSMTNFLTCANPTSVYLFLFLWKPNV